MDELTVLICDVATGEQVVRPMTANEIANLEAMKLDQIEHNTEAQAKADARESALAKLAALGLTQDEINAL